MAPLSAALSLRRGDLPPNLLLAAKLLALAHVWTLPGNLPAPFLPFFPFFDALPGAAFQVLLKLVYCAGLVLLFLSRHSRAACLVLGASVLAGELSSIPAYTNGKTFYALMMLMLGLHDPARGDGPLRGQLVVMYACCAMNKVLDPDWRSGRFFDNWFAVRLRHAPYLAASSWLPERLLAAVLSWGVIASEFALAGLFASSGGRRAGVWLAALLHTGMLVLIWGQAFGVFYYAVLISMLLFLDWPQGARLRLSPALAPAGALLRRLDPDGFWKVEAAGAGEPALSVELGGARLTGAAAARRVLLHSPAALAAVLITAQRLSSVRPLIALAGLALFALPSAAPAPRTEPA